MHPCTRLRRQLHGEGGDAAAGAEDEHRLPAAQAAAGEKGAIGRQSGEGQCCRLFPAEPCGLREHVDLGHGDELGERAVARATEDLEVGTLHLLPLTPAERRKDHDLLARVAPHPGAVGAGNQGKRKRIGATRDEQVPPVERSRSQLHDDLARGRDRVCHRLVAELASLVYLNCQHQRSDAQGSSPATSSTP